MTEITTNLLTNFAPQASDAEIWASALQAAAIKYEIDSPERLSMWLAQLAHETAGFRLFHEIWGPTEAQKRYERDFHSAWPPTKADPRNRKAHELGNDALGDGRKYRGRGCIQITGKGNYRKYGTALGLDLVADPDVAAGPKVAADVAGLYWQDHNLNLLADEDNYEQITRRINGGLNGWADRMHWLRRAKRVLT